MAVGPSQLSTRALLGSLLIHAIHGVLVDAALGERAQGRLRLGIEQIVPLDLGVDPGVRSLRERRFVEAGGENRPVPVRPALQKTVAPRGRLPPGPPPPAT